MKEKIIIALDFDQLEDAQKTVDALPDAVFFKVGLQAFLKFGDRIIPYLAEHNKKLFLDLKFKDIPNTVFGAVRSALKFSPDMLTIHLSGGRAMIKKAVEAAQEKPDLKVLGVTVLTSLGQEDLTDIGVNLSPRDAVLKLCGLGIDAGLKAVVCSPMEIEPIRQQFGSQVQLVTPGIRPAWAAKGDQKRVFTPKMAVEAGSDYLVIGRPITQHQNPAEAFDLILQEIS
jgi:orotidine-5'-phosphate decarboxylase